VGFLPTSRDATWMLDSLVLGTVGLLALLTWSLYVVRYKGGYARHKTMQLYLAGSFVVVLGLLEINLVLDTSWWDRALQSPYHQRGLLIPTLTSHRVAAIACCMLWIWTIVYALQNFAVLPTPGAHSRHHVRLARVAAGSLYATGLTGWLFYWMAFVAH
jgi:uncharacterized membrane protein YozB (DUF420 family)